MACTPSTLADNACDNGFMQLAQNEPLSRALMLQILYEAVGSTQTEAELLEAACDSGFLQIAQNEPLSRALMIQMLCEAN